MGVGGQRAEGCEKEGGGCELGRRRCHYDMRCHYVALPVGPMLRLRVVEPEAVIIKISISSNETMIIKKKNSLVKTHSDGSSGFIGCLYESRE